MLIETSATEVKACDDNTLAVVSPLYVPRRQELRQLTNNFHDETQVDTQNRK